MRIAIQGLALILILCGSLLTVSLASAVEGSIPRRYVSRPATDLVYQREALLPEEAHALYLKYNGHFDLSQINPAEDTDIWKNHFPINTNESDDSLKMNNLDEVKFLTHLGSTSGVYRFNVSKKDESDEAQLFTLMISKRNHGPLLLKTLLRKIGYVVPGMKHLEKVQVQFKDREELLSFKAFLTQEAMAGEAESWVIQELGDNKILLQDVVAMLPMRSIYNVALDPFTTDEIQGRRLLSSLAIPLALTNLTESINLFKWTSAHVANDSVFLDLDEASEYNPSFEDARWILRRILRLSRRDWSEIVDGAALPGLVKMVLLEKLISRRNHLMKAFKIDGEEIPVIDKLNSGVDLVDGKLIQSKFQGHAERFSGVDPESPLSDSEITSWIKSKAFHMALDGATSFLNTLPYLNSQVNDLNSHYYQKYIDDFMANPSQYQNPLNIPLSGWVFPTFRGNLILTRNISTGAFLGTDGMASLVDAVGVNFEAGAFAGVGGLPSPLFASGSAGGSFSRVYAHLRPVSSISTAIKYPFKNILIPLLSREYGNKLTKALSVNFSSMSVEEREKKLKDVLKDFYEHLLVGESISITDTFNAQAQVNGGASVPYLVQAQLGLGAGQVVVNRFHIHRRSENEIQIYRDDGSITSAQFSFALDSWVPILKANFKKSNGKAKTQFYHYDLSPESTEVTQSLGAIRQALIFARLRPLRFEKRPIVLEHNFTEGKFAFGAFFWRMNWQDATNYISVSHPDEKEKRVFVRATDGYNSGYDFQEFALETLRNITGLALNFNYQSTFSSSNPGFSFKGSAENRLTVFEGELKNEKLENSHLKIGRVWNGWEISQENAKRLIKNIQERYRHDFLYSTVLNSTQKIFLYSVNLQIVFNQAGLNGVMNAKGEDVIKAFEEYSSRDNILVNPENKEELSSRAKQFLDIRHLWRRHFFRKDINETAQYAMKTLKFLESNLNLHGMAFLAGGQRNIYAHLKVEGFRQGGERADKAILTDSYGEFGRRDMLGPLNSVKDKTRMIDGEFYLYWLLTRLI